jgi:hypothetical protein
VPKPLAYDLGDDDGARVGEYHWYCLDSQSQGFTSDGDAKLADHWLPRGVFESLTGGELLPNLRIRVYRSESDAMNALRRAENK